MKPEIENLIIKFLTKEADLHELQQLEMWIGNPKNERLFSEYVKTNMAVNRAMFKYDKNDAKAYLISSIRRGKNIPDKRFKINNYIRYAAAAIIIVIFSTTFYIKDDLLDPASMDMSPITVSSVIEPGTDKATLILEDGSVVALTDSFQKLSIGKRFIFPNTRH